VNPFFIMALQLDLDYALAGFALTVDPAEAAP